MNVATKQEHEIFAIPLKAYESKKDDDVEFDKLIEEFL